MDLYLICQGCGEWFHAMNYQQAYEHGLVDNWCGSNGFLLSQKDE